MYKLSEEFDKNTNYEFIEEEIFSEDTLIDKGYYLEFYGNPLDGKYDQESSEGSSVFIFFDEEVRYGDLLSLFAKDGCYVKDDTLQINIIPDSDSAWERERKLSKKWSQFKN